MTCALSAARVVIVGANGQMGRTACEMLAASPDRSPSLVAVDRCFAGASADRLRGLGATVHTVDVLAGQPALARLLRSADLVCNFAGPYYALGTAVLEAAIEAGCAYVDICDDADAVSEAIALDATVARAGITALVGAGSAPGVTNVLGRVALDALAAANGASATLAIAWATPVAELSPSIFRHICHSLRAPGQGVGAAGRWEDRAPRPIAFPDPVGRIETVLFGHPEPVTFRHYLGVDAELRGATVPPQLMHLAWTAAAGAATPEDAFEAFGKAVRPLAVTGTGACGALHVEAWRGGQGVRIQTVSDESMADTTVEPCLAFARMLLGGGVPRTGVVSPEALDPHRFFAAGISRGRGRAAAWRLGPDGAAEPVSLRRLLDTGARR
jgi:hypothetical protein